MTDCSDNLRFVFSGGAGGGKTSVLERLVALGFDCMPEAARGIIRDRLAKGMSPRPGPTEFAALVFAADVAQYDACCYVGAPVFFDRGMGDSLGMLHECSGVSLEEARHHLSLRPYNPTVFLFPPWVAIFAQDSERDQTFADAVTGAARLTEWYSELGFSPMEVPFGAVEERVEFVLSVVTKGTADG